jgi:hypothetical protein
MRKSLKKQARSIFKIDKRKIQRLKSYNLKMAEEK